MYLSSEMKNKKDETTMYNEVAKALVDIHEATSVDAIQEAYVVAVDTVEEEKEDIVKEEEEEDGEDTVEEEKKDIVKEEEEEEEEDEFYMPNRQNYTRKILLRPDELILELYNKEDLQQRLSESITELPFVTVLKRAAKASAVLKSSSIAFSNSSFRLSRIRRWPCAR